MAKSSQGLADRSSGDEQHPQIRLNHHWSLLSKMLAGGFVTIVAPVIVALTVKLFDSPPPAPPAPGNTAQTALPAEPDSPGSASRQKKAAPEYVPIFNGKDFTGWSVGESSHWTIDGENHALAGEDSGGPRQGGTRWIFTDEDYADFRLRFDYRFDGPAKGGVSVRTLPVVDPHTGRIRIQLVSDDHVDGTDYPTGNIAGLGTEGKQHIARALATGMQKPTGKWNTATIEFQGQQLRVWINRQLVQEIRAEVSADHPKLKEGLRLPKGRIGLQVIFGKIEFRNLQVEELPPPAK